jgi:hypothetical protein
MISLGDAKRTVLPDVSSYAQYGEDLVLWVALAHISKGFYIDVGASDPVQDSVTKLFYDRGWTGINIEPRRLGWAAIAAQRPRDINLQIAASDRVGTLMLHEIQIQPGLSTSVDQYANGYPPRGCGAKIIWCRADRWPTYVQNMHRATFTSSRSMWRVWSGQSWKAATSNTFGRGYSLSRQQFHAPTHRVMRNGST